MNGPRRIAAVVPHDQVAVFVLVLVTAWVALAIMLIEPRIAAGHLFVPLLAALSGVSVLGLSALAVRWWSRANVDLPRSFARGLATLLAIVAYVGTISALILVLDHDAGIEMAFGITALAALAIEPFRRSLQQRLDALLFGEQDSAYRVITDLGRRLETTTLPEEMLPAVVDAVAGALDLPYVAIELDGRTGSVVAAATGTAAGPLTRMQLTHQASRVGWLVLGMRTGERLSAPHRRLLEDLARQIGVAAHAVQLTHDLQRSHAMLVVARDEERRRLQRDLHDGLGPMLAGIDLAVQAARNLLVRDADAADTLLARVVAESRAATSDVRRLVYDLRPPALDRLGLVGAIREEVNRLSAHGSSADDLPHVVIDASPDIAALPPALEVGAFRIALEAFVNARRHANAYVCTIRLRVDDALHVEVVDDGDGIDPDARVGVGIRSMEERAAQLGGTCAVTRRSHGGTRVHARIPIGPLQ